MLATYSTHTAHNAYLPGAYFQPASTQFQRSALPLCETEIFDALTFLAGANVQSVILAGMLLDNGVDKELNRGTFYAYRGVRGEIEGIALIGHSTIIDSRSEIALREFARIARNTSVPMHLVLSSGEVSERFFDDYSYGRFMPRLTCTEISFVTRKANAELAADHQVRLATADELEPVARAQAEMAFIESGTNPLATDPEGFRKRVLRRIEEGRVWVVFEGGKLIFKADLITSTHEAAYIEGVSVDRAARGRGIGAGCLAAVCSELLLDSSAVILLSNVELRSAHACFEKAGFTRTGTCVTLFV
jgi:ribosomal protein S18 acetylase RimI-like enzyme